MPQVVEIAKVSDLKPGSSKSCEVGNRVIALIRTAEGFFALDNECVHRGGPLGDGFVEGDVVTCPWHGWQYSVKTGHCLNMANAKVASFPVSVQGESVMISI